jgi:hypothetical protein
VDFKVTGVGNQPGTITLADEATVTCHASGSDQENSATTKVSTSQAFTPHNGTYSGSISFRAGCPDHQSATDPIFSDVTITVSTPAATICEPVTNSTGQICSQAGGTATCSEC